MLLTRELDEKIRRCEIAGVRSGIVAAQRLRPHADVACIDVAGGVARFIGFCPSLSQAFGVGTLAPVSVADVARITEFYGQRDTAAGVYVSPMADPSLGCALAAAGYVPTEHENVLVSDDFRPHALRDERIDIARDVEDWARASAQGFNGAEPIEAADEQMAMVFASAEGVTALEGRYDDTIAATSVIAFRDGCAMFFAGSTLPGFRERGWHLAMVRDRISRAHTAGSCLMRAVARPSSSSERNFHRCGFTTLYTRTLWLRNNEGPSNV